MNLVTRYISDALTITRLFTHMSNIQFAIQRSPAPIYTIGSSYPMNAPIARRYIAGSIEFSNKSGYSGGPIDFENRRVALDIAKLLEPKQDVTVPVTNREGNKDLVTFMGFEILNEPYIGTSCSNSYDGSILTLTLTFIAESMRYEPRR